MISRRTFVRGIPWLLASRAGAQPPATVGVWTGAVTATAAVVKVLAAPGEAVRLRYDAAGVAPADLTADSGSDGVATFVLAKLAPKTRYRYTVGVRGTATDGSFRTFGDGPSSFRAVFASCADTGSNSAVFDAMRELEPDLFVHMGDLHYEDIGRNDVSVFRQAFTRVLGSPRQSALLREVPIAYVWDDHDYGPNNSDRSSRSRPAALEAYRRFVPHYPLGGGDADPIAQAFDVGRLRVIMLDVRSGRSSSRLPADRRTMLGAVQLEWLERQLAAAADAPLVLLVNPIPWIGRRGWFISQGWSGFPEERRRIADAIVRAGLTERLVMLSGDAHMLALDDGTHSQYSTLADAPRRGFVVAHAAPMDRPTSRKGGPYSHPPVLGNGQFGLLEVNDDGRQVRVVIQGMRGREPVAGMRLERVIG